MSEFKKVVYNEKFRVLLNREQIESRIKELGREITREYEDKNPIMVGVLNGAFIFMADLIRYTELDMEIDFIKISSYGNSKKSTGKVRILKDMDAEIKGRHVLVVEDIVDTGLSIKYLMDRLGARQPASLKFVSLLFKPESVIEKVHIDHIGFEIPSSFVVGYGLDHQQILRNLPAIYVMDEQTKRKKTTYHDR
ncbi:hypoxanthine phosphoribosyltransferase [candidate division KSB1 bacterium]|nr:hypoxanthine phosphoribosyltransferase [candidate division KSB1 bacterium]